MSRRFTIECLRPPQCNVNGPSNRVNPLSSIPAHPDSRSLAASLAPLVVQACGGRLGDITWFKTDWQRGGAATGKSTFKTDDGQSVPVILKLPVVQRELHWTRSLQDDVWAHNSAGDIPIPRLYACGETLGGYDLAWIVIEQFPHGPLGLHWHDDHIPRLVEAAARFHAAAEAFAVDAEPRQEDWPQLLHESADNVRTNHIGHDQRWSAAIKTLRHRLPRVLAEWNARDVQHWLHGDLHLANGMSRVALDSGPVCLIDLAEVHAGHWVEDAVYLERQLWARPERLKLHKPVKEMSAARKRFGLKVEGDYPRLAMIRRGLLAATAPRFIKSEGHPGYLEACLTWLEIALNELK